MSASPTTDPSILDSLSEHWQAIVSGLTIALGWTVKRILKRNDDDNSTRDKLIGELSRQLVKLEKRVAALEMANHMCKSCPTAPHLEESYVEA